MKTNESIKEGFFEGERSLFQAENLKIYDTVFGVGESPLKESNNIELYNTLFKWKYPLWYSKNIKVKDCTWFEMARAGVWYTNDIEVCDSVIEAPKNFRRCNNLKLENVSLPNAEETLWNCNDVVLNNVTAKGDYLGMGCSNVEIENLNLVGNYCFDGVKNLTIKNSKLLAKDAFWNCENVMVYNSFISGEYLGWNSKNVTLVDCTIESEQGMCYMDNVVMKNCKLLKTNLAFEYSKVDAQINSGIDSVKNPISGKITANKINEIIFDNPQMEEKNTVIKQTIKSMEV